MAKILLIDDDELFREHLTEELEERDFEVHAMEQPEKALALLSKNEPFDLVLLDNKMPRMTGMEFLEHRKGQSYPPIILMTGEPTDRTAIAAANKGAFAYVIKPMDLNCIIDEEWEEEIVDALEWTRRRQKVSLSPTIEPLEDDDSTIVGRSRLMLKVFSLIGRFADMNETVLIQGETGTGKDLVAQALHTNSRRKDKPYVVLNCAALSENLLEDELFGHEVGAFTGATRLRKGRFEHASGGTLFLDEVGDMPASLQVKLLRTLENREVTRVGSNEPIVVDVRVVAATHRDLEARVSAGEFREDLFYRLRGLTISLPPLRERKEDLPLLIGRFLARYSGGSDSAPQIHPDAMEALCNSDWPGNIRQLQKVLCKAVGMCRGSILPEDLDFGDSGTIVQHRPSEPGSEEDAITGLQSAIRWAWKNKDKDLWPVLQELLERELLQFACAEAEKSGISQVQLAKLLGMARNTLRDRIEKHRL